MSSPASSPQSARSAAVAPAAAAEPAEAQCCPLCMEAFATEAAAAGGLEGDHRPRVLGCGHSFCGACLHSDMKQRRCCPTCRTAITHPDAASVPLNFELIAALSQGAEAAAQVVALQRRVAEAEQQSRAQPVVPCSECDETAAHYCAECDDDLCDVHLQQLHARKKFQSHKVVGIAEKAALLAAAKKREAREQANRCALHKDQIKYFYCGACAEAVCTVCMHAKHSDCKPKPVLIGVAAAEARTALARQLASVAGSAAEQAADGDDGADMDDGSGVSTLQAAARLGRKLRGMQQGQAHDTARRTPQDTELTQSAIQARGDVDALCNEVKKAAERRCAELRLRLQQQEEAAASRIAELLAASDCVATEGAQLSAAVAEASGSDDYDALADAARVSQLFVDVEAQLRALDQQVAEVSGQSGWVSALRFNVDGKAALLSGLAEVGAVAHQTTVIAPSQPPVAAAPSVASASSSSSSPAVTPQLQQLQGLESQILQPAHHVDLAQFSGQIASPAKLIYRASRDGFKAEDWAARCLGKGPTTTLVKVEESGFVFGAYTHCKWPSQVPSSRERVTVADPSGLSFLFSLVNGTGKAVRFSLLHKEGAIQLVNGEVRFGADIKEVNGNPQTCRNLDLMNLGRAADQPNGIYARANNHISAYQPDDATVKCGSTFFGGQQQFAAAEIEVFEL